MKLLAVLTLAATLTSASAATEFGGLKFHSSMPKVQIEQIKVDLSYLYNTPVTRPDPVFMGTAQVSKGDGPNMHNWLLNRVRYIVGESFQLDNRTVLQASGYRFPNTPLPDAFSSTQADGKKEFKPVVVMSNLGGAVYLMGKQANTLLGVNFDGEKVMLTSARVGLLQVGEGLFLPRFLLNPNVNAPANSISRLGTLFHEARHSDGNGKSNSFTHDICPPNHPYKGAAACEFSVNGSYTVGGLSEKHMLMNCSQCSEKELGALTAKVADSFNRILKLTPDAKRFVIQTQIDQKKQTIEQYKKMRPSQKPDVQAEIDAEIKNIEARIVQLENDKRNVSPNMPSKSIILDPRPEGQWQQVSLQASQQMMDRSLKIRK